MHLSEKLKLNYCNTTVLLKEYERHLKLNEDFNKKYSNVADTIWQSPESPYYKTLLRIKEKQDAGKIVTDDEYRAIPNCGMSYFLSTA